MTSSLSLESSEELSCGFACGIHNKICTCLVQHGDEGQGTGDRLAEGSEEQEEESRRCQKDQCFREYREWELLYDD